MTPIDRRPGNLILLRYASVLYKPALAAVTYYAAAKLAFLIGTLSDRIFAPFWPPNVVLLCVLLLAPARRWPVYFAAIFVAHAAAEAGIGMPTSQMLLAFATNCSVAFIGAAMLRITTSPPWLGSARSAALYILITAGIAPAVAAFGGALVPIAGGGSPDQYWLFWSHWYVANALACLTFGPIALSWLETPHRQSPFAFAEWSWEAVISGALLAAACLIAMRLAGFVSASYLPVLLLMPLPVVLWITYRFGVRGASAANLGVTVMLVSHALDDSSLLAASDVETNVLALQLLLTGLSVPTLLLGAAIDHAKAMHAATAFLIGSVLKAQDDERREVARELHDNTGQNLVAATLLLGKLQKTASAPPDVLSELTGMLQRSIVNLRSMSYGLHPPLLDEAGLPLALQSHIGRLKAACGFSVDVDLPDDIERLSPDLELALFRLIQETLDTMGRGGDRHARVLLARGIDASRPNVILTIESERDDAPSTFASKLMNPPDRARLPGMAFAGVRERIRQLGGVVELRSAAGRTLVKAVVPLELR